MRSSLSTAVALHIGGALAASSSLYHYMPVEFAYGADSRVTADIVFGTAPSAKPVRVVMDSGSPSFWIWAPNATINFGSPYLGATGPCNAKVPVNYDPAQSSTSSLVNRSSNYFYASNSKIVYGVQFANDTIAGVGGSGPIPNVQFALENSALLKGASPTCEVPEYDLGIVGLSHYDKEKTGSSGSPSFRQNLFESGRIASKTMFMWFDKHLGALGDLNGGVLFGAIDESKFTGPLVEVANVIPEYQIAVHVAKPNITFNGRTFAPDDDVRCLVDSGAHADSIPFLFGGPAEKEFFAAADGLLVDYAGIVAYNGTCESIPQSLNLTYTFAGVRAGKSVDISIPLRNFARGLAYPDTTGLCLLNLGTGGCTLGAPFQSAAAILNDDEGDRVAFAQAAVCEEHKGVNADAVVVLNEAEALAFWDTL
ncbi:uncharacterized protein RSE6_14503 [Rhynchosporium secalis]|uniref:Peptidase A1 domain-containing protein n=1 Tax=Rhynchosporium secalis TaxID=38038 RepID=A0A1E1MVF5_RHYSE|nr:uncharacterized protein RSE6_14503 [Rhynchosporium secalis]